MTRSVDLALRPPAALAASGGDVPHPRATHDFETVYAEHGAFVWRTLRALGVPAPQVEDAVQDVFVVVHGKLASFHGPAKLETWLFAIARRVASHYRRSAGRHGKTEPLDAARQIAAAAETFEEASRKEASEFVLAVLAELDEAKREILILIELEQVPVTDVAALLEIPLNTAYSRLRLARRAFASALRRRREGGSR